MIHSLDYALYLIDKTSNEIPWVQIVIAIVVGLSGAGFASVLKAIFGKKLTDAKADAQIVHNAQEIISELKERLAEVQADSKLKSAELNTEIQELKRTLREERRLAQEEVARLKQEITAQEAEIRYLKGVR